LAREERARRVRASHGRTRDAKCSRRNVKRRGARILGRGKGGTTLLDVVGETGAKCGRHRRASRRLSAFILTRPGISIIYIALPATMKSPRYVYSFPPLSPIVADSFGRNSRVTLRESSAYKLEDLERACDTALRNCARNSDPGGDPGASGTFHWENRASHGGVRSPFATSRAIFIVFGRIILDFKSEFNSELRKSNASTGNSIISLELAE